MERLICVKQVVEQVGMSRAWVYRQVKAGCFPAPVKLNGVSSRWSESAVQEWIQQRVAMTASMCPSNQPIAASFLPVV